MRDGTAEGEAHLGVSHTLKHYLRASEMWQDVAEAVPDTAQPRPLALALEVVDSSLDDPAYARRLRGEHWTSLRHAHHDGYHPIVAGLAEDLPEPHAPGSSRRWVVDRGRFIAHAGEGVVLTVARERDGWRVWTAYRAADFRLRDYRCPPSDPRNVSLRRKLATATAERRLAIMKER